MCVDAIEAKAFEDRVRREVANGGAPLAQGTQMAGIERRRPDENAGIYFVEAANGPIKIGFTSFLEHRLRSLRYQCPVALTLRAFIGGDRKAEREYHARFSAHRLHGEWFSPHEEILGEIERIGESGGPPCC